MEKEKLFITKPEFESEIKAQIKGLAEIEDNISEVKDYAVKLQEYYGAVIWSEETLTDAKNEKANINKFKTKVADFRKTIVAQYNEPIKAFEQTAKETEQLLKETYDNINNSVMVYEEETKKQIALQCKEYFEELKTVNELDFVDYENMKQNITLGSATKTGALTKKTTEEIDAFINQIISDLELIEEEEHKLEIMVEYKKTLNASNSILEVKRRIKAVEEEKARIEAMIPTQEVKEAQEARIDAITAPKEMKAAPEIKKMTFTVMGTIEELKKIKTFLEKEGIRYE